MLGLLHDLLQGLHHMAATVSSVAHCEFVGKGMAAVWEGIAEHTQTFHMIKHKLLPDNECILEKHFWHGA